MFSPFQSENGLPERMNPSSFTTTYSEKLLPQDKNVDDHENDFFLLEPGQPPDQLAATQVNIDRGSAQPPQFRDIVFAFLFVLQLVVIIYLALAWGVPALFSSSSDKEHSFGLLSICHVLLVGLLCGLATMAWTALLINFLQRHVQTMVQLSLFITVGCYALLAVVFLWQQYWVGVLFALLFVIWGSFYARAVWRRIPFASANLQTALTAVQSNGGLAIVAYAMVLASQVYTTLWILAAVGVVYRKDAKSADSSSFQTDDTMSMMSSWTILLFLLSFYWTTTVLRNILSATVAGVVGTWWFAPDEASTYCSPAIMDSLFRASTYSLGSIALGSLLTAILQVTNTVLKFLRNQAATQNRSGARGASFFLCVLDCSSAFLHRLITYFNKYAMVYIGLYGYDHLTAGRRVFTLFQQRGWSVIVSDDLVARILWFVSIVLALLTAAVGVALATLWQPLLWWTNSLNEPTPYIQHATIAAGITFLLGWALAQLLLSVVAAAVDTILVTFAEAPLDLERNHPGLHRLMVTAWQQVYPDCQI